MSRWSTSARIEMTSDGFAGHRGAQQCAGLRIGGAQATSASDLDLLVGAGPETSPFDLAGFALDVEALLGVFTQVATEPGLKPRVRPKALTDAQPL
jgi:hypothetical protein